MSKEKIEYEVVWDLARRLEKKSDGPHVVQSERKRTAGGKIKKSYSKM